MKLCPLGHENTDDATRCHVCLRRFPAEPPRLELTGVPETPVALQVGEVWALDLGVTQHGGEAGAATVTLDGEAAGWADDATLVVAVEPEVPVEVRILLAAPEGSAPGLWRLAITASAPEGAPVEAEAFLRVVVPEPEPTPAPVPTTPPEPPPPPPEPPAPPEPESPPPTAPIPAPIPAPTPAPTPAPPTAPTPAPTPAPPPAPAPAPAPPPTPAPTSGTEKPDPGRRRAVVAVLALLLVVVVIVVISRLPFGPQATLSPEQALELPVSEARAELSAIATGDASRTATSFGGNGFVVQLSGKCERLTDVDLRGPDGIGVPDGTLEHFEAGVGAPGILAFHLGAREAWGQTVFLVGSADLGPTPCPDGSPGWFTMDAPEDGPYPTGDAALCECLRRGLPFGECGARPTDGRETVFWNAELAATLTCS